MLLVAGHETSGHAISFAFAALAVYPEIQQKALEEVRAVVPVGQLPVGQISIYLLLSLSNS
jgi:cytochrome P450